VRAVGGKPETDFSDGKVPIHFQASPLLFVSCWSFVVPAMTTAPESSCEPGTWAAVMRTMGHRDVKTAMLYQHPELEVVRAALD